MALPFSAFSGSTWGSAAAAGGQLGQPEPPSHAPGVEYHPLPHGASTLHSLPQWGGAAPQAPPQWHGSLRPTEQPPPPPQQPPQWAGAPVPPRRGPPGFTDHLQVGEITHGSASRVPLRTGAVLVTPCSGHLASAAKVHWQAGAEAPARKDLELYSNAKLVYPLPSLIGTGMTHIPPTKPHWEGIPRVAFQLHIIEGR